MFRRAKSLLLAIAVCAVGMAVPLSNTSTAKAASLTETTGDTTSWISGSNLTCGTEEAFNSLAVMKKDGYSAVNLNWRTDLSSEQLDTYLTECENLGLQSVVSLWDANGKSDIASLKKCVNYWTQDDVVKVMQNHKSATIEVAAGWDPGDTATWQAAYEEYLPLIDSAFQYDCNVCLSTPSCTDCSSAEEAANKIVSASDCITLRLHWVHISIDVAYVTIVKWGPFTFTITVHKHYDVWVLAPWCVPDDIYVAITYYRQLNIPFFPLHWYDTSTTYNMTSDWVNYTDVGQKVSDLMLN